MLPDYFGFHVPTKVAYSQGLASKLAEEMQVFGRRRALLVTDRIIDGLGFPEKVIAGLKGSKVRVVGTYSDVPPNSEVSAVEACADAGIEARANMVIALGGGSVIDTAKVANILMKKGGRVADHQGAQLLKRRLFPLVVIPTTAGTGSEVTRVAVIADVANDIKFPFTEDVLQPDLAVLDPEMTRTMPPRVTAATGMDALTHAVEAYVGTEWSPASDAMALEAIKMIGRSLLTATAHPEDLHARGEMLVASCLAGIAFSHSMVGIVHGMAHALGGVYHVPHGEANSILLPLGMEYNLDARAERYAYVARALGVHPLATPRMTAQMGIYKLRLMCRQLAYLGGLPVNLEQAGVDDDLARLDQVVETAMADGAMLYNPTPVYAEGVRKILQRAYDRPGFSVPKSKRRLKPEAAARKRKEITGAFATSDELYDTIGNFLRSLADHPELGPTFVSTNLKIRFVYRNPVASITIDCSGDELEIEFGDHEFDPEIEMSMESDFAHMFWLGKANLLTALTRRQVTSRGAVQKAVKLLPVLVPAFKLYPEFLRGKGMDDLIV